MNYSSVNLRVVVTLSIAKSLYKILHFVQNDRRAFHVDYPLKQHV